MIHGLVLGDGELLDVSYVFALFVGFGAGLFVSFYFEVYFVCPSACCFSQEAKPELLKINISYQTLTGNCSDT